MPRSVPISPKLDCLAHLTRLFVWTQPFERVPKAVACPLSYSTSTASDSFTRRGGKSVRSSPSDAQRWDWHERGCLLPAKQ